MGRHRGRRDDTEWTRTDLVLAAVAVVLLTVLAVIVALILWSL